jgi:hypothetical protein
MIVNCKNGRMSWSLGEALQKEFPGCDWGQSIGNSGHCTCGYGCDLDECKNAQHWLVVPDYWPSSSIRDVIDWYDEHSVPKNVKGKATVCLRKKAN